MNPLRQSELKKSHRERNLAYAALWISLFLWGLQAPGGRYLSLAGVPILGVMAVRFWIGFLCFGIYLFITGKFDFSLKVYWKEILFLFSGGLFLNAVTYHYGLKFIPATLAMLVENLAPFFVFLFALLFDKNKASKLEISLLVFSFSGLVFIVAGKGGLTLTSRDFYWGVTLELIAALTWGLYIYLSAKLLKGFSAHKGYFGIINLLFLLMGLSALAGTPFLFTLIETPFRIRLTWPQFWIILEMGIGQTFLAYILWNHALAKLPSTRVSILFYMTVVFTIINEMVFLGFRLNPILIIGACVIMGSAVFLTLKKETVMVPD
ncbi:MAG: DMT family transporter [Desulfobacteraceae bacterium]|nr:MAG: DMT family transporter [Desulfobacteraceae bacterium]